MRATGQLALVFVLASSFVNLNTSAVGHAASLTAFDTQSPSQGAAPSSASRPVGAIKSINGKSIVLTSDSGSEVTVVAQNATKFLRIAPGEKDLKNATPIQLQDLQVGDRILVRGKLAGDSKSVLATSIVVMKRSDVEAKQQREREDWQKRGVGGLVNAIDPASGTITVSTTSSGPVKTIAVRSTKDTVLRRYAPDSVKFDDAKPGTLDQIKIGDQLRARGTRNAIGDELTAEEIVTGSFRNIAGTISSVDSAAGTITVTDLVAKKPVVVKVTSESQVRKLPPEIAQRLAMRLKGSGSGADAPPSAGPSGGDRAGGGARSQQASAPRAGNSADREQRTAGGMPGAHASHTPDTGSASATPRQPQHTPPFTVRSSGDNSGAAGPNGLVGPGGTGPGGLGGAPDLQQILSHMPAATLADLQKGDAVMIVSTKGSASGEVTAITLLGGVEPILTATPKGGQPMSLSPWSLGQGGEAGAGNP